MAWVMVKARRSAAISPVRPRVAWCIYAAAVAVAARFLHVARRYRRPPSPPPASCLIRPYCRAPRHHRLDDRWTGSFDGSVRKCTFDSLRPEGSKGVEPCACSACRLHPLVPEDAELLGYIRHQLHEHSADAIEDDGRRKVLTREADVKRIPALGRSADDFRRVLGALEARDRLGSDRPLVREEDWQLMCTIHKNAREHGLSAPPLALMTEEDRRLFNERRTSDRDLQRYEKLGTMDGIRRFVDDTLALADVEVPMPVGDATKAKCVRAWRQGRSEAECSRHVCALCETCVRPRDMERTASGLKGYTVRGVEALLMQGYHSNACDSFPNGLQRPNEQRSKGYQCMGIPMRNAMRAMPSFVPATTPPLPPWRASDANRRAAPVEGAATLSLRPSLALRPWPLSGGAAAPQRDSPTPDGSSPIAYGERFMWRPLGRPLLARSAFRPW